MTIQQLDQYGSGVGCSILIAVSPIILMIIASLFRIEIYNFVELIFLGDFLHLQESSRNDVQYICIHYIKENWPQAENGPKNDGLQIMAA